MTTLPRPAAPSADDFLRDVLAGLSRADKRLPCKYFYDRRGSELFDQICGLDEYYLTRCELEVLRAHGAEVGARLGPGCAVVEYGSGSGVKTELLLDRLPGAAAYVPVDISAEHLLRSARRLARRYPAVQVVPVVADFTRPFALPALRTSPARIVVFFSGSTIGNFGPAEATALLAQIAGLCGPGGGLLIGVDLKKGAAVLEPAYDDGRGVTAAFNLNLLARVNAELGGDFDLGAFRHRAFYDAGRGRVEMHLVSQKAQTAHVGGRAFGFAAGETICTEYSHKYSPEEFASLARAAGLEVERVWADARGWYSVQYLRVAADEGQPGGPGLG